MRQNRKLIALLFSSTKIRNPYVTESRVWKQTHRCAIQRVIRSSGERLVRFYTSQSENQIPR